MTGRCRMRRKPRRVAELETQFAESGNLAAAIKANLEGLGYGGLIRWKRKRCGKRACLC